MELTKEEKNAIQTLKRLAERWPKSLWLYSSQEVISIMKYKKRKEAAMIGMSYDPDYKVTDVKIPHDYDEY